ncbi:DUF4148 domain-containing protein [Pseudoduganella flava]|nr:DUF4148 domain-containing protein [Pseudoduganella flava]
MMKTAYYVIAALALATAGAAFGAEEPAAATATATTAVTATQAPQAAPVAQSRGLTREQVQAQVIEARRNGTLIETEADMDVARTKQQVAR